MAEPFNSKRLTGPRPEIYRQLRDEVSAVLEGETDPVARMSTLCAMVFQTLENVIWAGFYRVDPQRPAELVAGPYQGTLGCLRITVGKGVCGTAAASGQTQVVADVHAFEGHIACDARSRSEIVLPVFDRAGHLVAVFDLDSDIAGRFDDVDRAGLEALVAGLFNVAMCDDPLD